MPLEIRKCPHCSANVTGDTERCPRCDGLLNEPPTDQPMAYSEAETLTEDADVELPTPLPTFADEVEDYGGRTELDPAALALMMEAPTALPTDVDYAPFLTVPPPAPLPIVETQERLPTIYEGEALSPYGITDIPAAPYTPPPIHIAATPVMPLTASPAPMSVAPSVPMQQPAQPTRPSDYWLRQRVQAYQLGRYVVVKETPYEVVLSRGKELPFLWWVVGTTTIIGVLWYFLILLFAGFRRDKVYIVLESDGYIFEEGPGAAHIRRQRWRRSKRWGFVGVVLGFLAIATWMLLVFAGVVVGRQYKAEIEKAYPELTFYESTNQTEVDQARVDEAQVLVLIFAALFNLAFILFGLGYLMAIIGYIQAAAHRVEVAPLPGYR